MKQRDLGLHVAELLALLSERESDLCRLFWEFGLTPDQIENVFRCIRSSAGEYFGALGVDVPEILPYNVPCPEDRRTGMGRRVKRMLDGAAVPGGRLTTDSECPFPPDINSLLWDTFNPSGEEPSDDDYERWLKEHGRDFDERIRRVFKTFEEQVLGAGEKEG